MPVTAPARKAMERPSASDRVAAWAVRTLARTETCMPTKPAAPDSVAPIRKPTATGQPRRYQITANATTPTMAMVVYWRAR